MVSSVDNRQKKIMLGWREWVSLPQLGIDLIKAKVDTGARSSALHTFELQNFEENGVARVRFSISPIQDNSHTVRLCVADLCDERYVTDSGGHRELRPVICTSLHIGNMVRNIEITLTHRGTMTYGMLLGRTAIKGLYTVDPEASFLRGKPDNTSDR
jgi:hypothetical protein